MTLCLFGAGYVAVRVQHLLKERCAGAWMAAEQRNAPGGWSLAASARQRSITAAVIVAPFPWRGLDMLKRGGVRRCMNALNRLHFQQAAIASSYRPSPSRMLARSYNARMRTGTPEADSQGIAKEQFGLADFAAQTQERRLFEQHARLFSIICAARATSSAASINALVPDINVRQRDQRADGDPFLPAARARDNRAPCRDC